MGKNMQYDNISDEELITRMKNGDSAILDYLMDKYKDMVRKRSHAMYLIGGDTDDLIQEGMIGLFKAIRDYRPCEGASFLTFAGLCVDRQLFTAIRSSNRQKHMPLNNYLSLSHGEADQDADGELISENPESIIIDKEKEKDLHRKIRKILSPMEFKVLEMYLEGAGYQTIGERLNKSPKAIDNAIQRCRKKIKKVIDNGDKL